MHIPTLNNVELDADHQRIFDYLNELGDTDEDFYKKLVNLQRYLLSHALKEEALMASVKYPRTLEHAWIHEALVAKAGTFMVGRLGVEELGKVLAHHIDTEDRKFAEWKAAQEV
jgi:hemerythrin-like metal-binding protein